MAKANSIKNINQLTSKQVAVAIGPSALRRVRISFERIKREMLRDFNSHPVTREIEGGARSANISGTLGGKGNLFSFIGFEGGTKPVEPIRRLITRSYVRLAPPIAGMTYFEFFLPDIEEVYMNTPMPWAAGRSWARGIEAGMSGLGQYAYSKKTIQNSRSGTAVQSENNLRTANYRPVQYMSAIIASARSKIENLIL